MFNFLFNVIYYLVNFVISIFFLLLGIFVIILPWSPLVTTNFTEIILNNAISISLFGFGFVVIGLTMLVTLYINSKRRYYYVKAGKNPILIDEEIILQYIQTYWKQIFPHEDIPTHLVLKKNRIKITAELPHMPPQEQKEIVKRIQDDFQDIFTRTLGYPHEFMLALRFQPK